MLSKRVCEQCRHCKSAVFYGPIHWLLKCDKSAYMIITPPQTSTDDICYTNPTPEGCPYDLEHLLEMQDG